MVKSCNEESNSYKSMTFGGDMAYCRLSLVLCMRDRQPRWGYNFAPEIQPSDFLYETLRFNKTEDCYLDICRCVAKRTYKEDGYALDDVV